MVAVRISEFKAHLSKYLRQVKGGVEMDILDRGTAVARVVPMISENLSSFHAPLKKPEELGQLKSAVTSFEGEVMDVLLLERQRR